MGRPMGVERDHTSIDRLARAYYRIYARFDAAAIANSLPGRGLLWSIGTTGSAFYTIRGVKQRPWFVRSSMFSVRKQLPEAKRRHEASFPMPQDVQDLRDLRVACVADPFTIQAYTPECHLCPLGAADWKERIETFRPHLLFVESAWNGPDDSWKWKVSIVSPELIELVHWCKQHGIPTVFWNKEDPKHFETFIRTAEFFDVIFTTCRRAALPPYRP